MSFSYRNILMVCACALGINGFAGAASAQDASQAMENQMKANAEALPVPEADMSAPVMEAKKPPTPVLSSTSPETVAVAKATQVGSYNPRAVDRIITLRDAVGVGVLTNPQTETVENNRRATDEELQQAKALYLPSVDLRADTGYQSIYSDPDGSVEGHSDLWRSQASLTLTQMLFDGMSTHYENERQRHRVVPGWLIDRAINRNLGRALQHHGVHVAAGHFGAHGRHGGIGHELDAHTIKRGAATQIGRIGEQE